MRVAMAADMGRGKLVDKVHLTTSWARLVSWKEALMGTSSTSMNYSTIRKVPSKPRISTHCPSSGPFSVLKFSLARDQYMPGFTMASCSGLSLWCWSTSSIAGSLHGRLSPAWILQCSSTAAHSSLSIRRRIYLPVLQLRCGPWVTCSVTIQSGSGSTTAFLELD